MAKIKHIALVLPGMILPMWASAAIDFNEATAATVSSMTASITPDPAAGEFPDVRKIDDGLYSYKLPTAPEQEQLWFGAEKVTTDNLEYWQHFANTEVFAAQHVVLNKLQPYKKDFYDLINGSQYFVQALDKIDCAKYELWVGYITKKEPTHIDPSIKKTYTDPFTHSADDFAGAIRMFVTGTTHREALFTTHLGVAASVRRTHDSIISGIKPRPISVDLHSHLAKVMWMRNPHMRYMINRPVDKMGNIITKAMDKVLPGNLFHGTRQGERNGELELFKVESRESYDKETMGLKGFRHSGYNSLRHLNGTKEEPTDEELQEAYNTWVRSPTTPEESAPRRHPAILEVEEKTITVFEPGTNTVWLNADTETPVYGFFPQLTNFGGSYLAVNLEALARAKP